MNSDFIESLFYSIEKEQFQHFLDFYFFETQDAVDGHVNVLEFNTEGELSELWVYLIADTDSEFLETRMAELCKAAIASGMFNKVIFEYAVIKTKTEWGKASE